MILILVIILANQLFYLDAYGKEINLCLEKLNRVLSFIEKKHYEFNFDGLFGVVLAQGKLIIFHNYHLLFSELLVCRFFLSSAQLMKIDNLALRNSTMTEYIKRFIAKCHLIKMEILPNLPLYPPYMIPCKFFHKMF